MEYRITLGERRDMAASLCSLDKGAIIEGCWFVSSIVSFAAVAVVGGGLS